MHKDIRRRIPALGLSLLMLVALLAGCGRCDGDSSSDSSEKEVMNTTVLKADPSDFLVSTLTAATSTVHGGGFNAAYLTDMDPTTAWAEGNYDEGAGESIMLEIPAGTVITGGMIMPGWWRSKKAFQEYAAPTRISISSGEEFQEVSLSKYASSWKKGFQGYTFKLRKSVVSDGMVRVYITGTRSGSKYPHSCISELHLKGKLPEETETGSVTLDEVMNTTNEPFDRACRLECIYKNHLNWPAEVQDLTLSASDLTPEDKAFALFQYQYFITDARIHYDSETLNKSTKAELQCIMEELFGPLSDGDIQCFYDNYVEKIKKNTCKMTATGEFGAGDYLFFTDVQCHYGEDSVTVTGSVYQYGEDDSSYVGGQFTGVFDLPDPDSGNYCFRSLTVTRNAG